MKSKMKMFMVSMMLVLIASIGTTNADTVGGVCFVPSDRVARAHARAICDADAENAGFIAGNLKPCIEAGGVECPECQGVNEVFHSCVAHGPPCNPRREVCPLE